MEEVVGGGQALKITTQSFGFSLLVESTRLDSQCTADRFIQADSQIDN